MRDGPAAGLELIDEILERGDLANYHPAYVVRGDLCRRLGKTAEARTAYEQALALAEQEPEQRFIEQQLASLSG
jgi:RNA polymerase sigma-70 factor (ECF subfamily)